MTLFQKLRNKVLISVRRKKNHSMHYKMWDYIVAQLLNDSDESLSDKYYIADLKKKFLKLNNCSPYKDCFLCDLYFGTQEKGCAGCPIYDMYGVACISYHSLFCIVNNRENKRVVRIEAAKMIRDCVLRKGGK